MEKKCSIKRSSRLLCDPDGLVEDCLVHMRRDYEGTVAEASFKIEPFMGIFTYQDGLISLRNKYEIIDQAIHHNRSSYCAWDSCLVRFCASNLQIRSLFRIIKDREWIEKTFLIKNDLYKAFLKPPVIGKPMITKYDQDALAITSERLDIAKNSALLEPKDQLSVLKTSGNW